MQRYYKRAEEACLKAISVDPNFVKGKLSLAWVYLYGKQSPREAILYFNEVLEKVKNPIIYFGRGMAYSMSGDKAHVLDAITTLRGMNEDELASKLEASIREKYIPPSISEILPPGEDSGGTLVGSSPKSKGSDEKPISPSVSGGQMRIRLRGTLMNVDEDSSSGSGHPGSL